MAGRPISVINVSLKVSKRIDKLSMCMRIYNYNNNIHVQYNGLVEFQIKGALINEQFQSRFLIKLY